MRRDRLTLANDDPDGRNGRIARGVPRALLVAGFTAIVLCSVWSLLHRNWVELAAAVGLGAGLLICLSWRRARRTAAERR